MIELSVCIPMFRAEHIGWLPMEALCRQENIDFEWELVIAEEMYDKPFSKDKIKEYREKLRDKGCVKVKYIGVKKWIPLSKKYNLLASNCEETSKIYCSCVADLYPAPKRLKTQYDIFKNHDVAWCASEKTIFYDIFSQKTFLFDISLSKRKNDGSNRAFRMEIMKALPMEDRRSGLDGWTFKFGVEYMKAKGKKFKTYLDTSDNWKHCLNVHGLNNISHHRTSWFYSEAGRPDAVTKCPIDIYKTIPKDIMDRLHECKKYVKR